MLGGWLNPTSHAVHNLIDIYSFRNDNPGLLVSPLSGIDNGLFWEMFDIGATALILVHNHPSGNPEPSRADIQITQRIAEAGRLLGIAVHDHVIVGREGHVSLRAKGLIQP